MSDEQPTITAENATRVQASVMVFLETTLVDYGGTVEAIRLNSDDMAAIEELTKSGHIEKFLRMPATLLGAFTRKITHTVDFTEAGWALACALRRARAARMRLAAPRSTIELERTRF